MKLYFWLLVLWSCPFSFAYSASQTEIVRHTDSLHPERDGFWSEKKSWKSRWVKYWTPKTIHVPIWKKVWSPVVQKEWMPMPNTPPGWSRKNSNRKVTAYEY